MIRAVCGFIAAVTAVILSGCATGAGDFGWVTDSDAYWKLSGFSVQAPSGSDWYKTPQDDDHPNSIGFVKVQPTAIRFNPYHPEFTITSVLAYGTAINSKAEGKDKEVVLKQLLESYQSRVGVTVLNSSYDDSLGTACVTYQGNQTQPDVNTQYGVIRYDRVAGYLCLHPDYDDFVIGLEMRNGASVEIEPINRDEQTQHFFKSIQFTPRATVPAGAPSKAVGRARG